MILRYLLIFFPTAAKFLRTESVKCPTRAVIAKSEPGTCMLCHSIYLQVEKVHLFNLGLPMNRYTFVLPSENQNAFAFACSPSAQMLFIGDGCWHPDSILTLTVFQSRQFFTLARPYIKYMLYSLQNFRHISCMVSILTI